MSEVRVGSYSFNSTDSTSVQQVEVKKNALCDTTIVREKIQLDNSFWSFHECSENALGQYVFMLIEPSPLSLDSLCDWEVWGIEGKFT